MGLEILKLVVISLSHIGLYCMVGYVAFASIIRDDLDFISLLIQGSFSLISFLWLLGTLGIVALYVRGQVASPSSGDIAKPFIA